jgi:hypothetical protein
MSSVSREPHVALLIVGAWLVVMLQLVLQYWPETALTLNDTDDAMRLVELRDWLAGQGWFDLHEARVQPPTGYDTHWSRLIDAGLAGVYLLARPFADIATAERLMRAVWPMLWLLPAIAGVTAIAWRIAGREAALMVLLLAAIGLPAFQQFKPGRIDHHNVQIAIAVLSVAATAWSDRVRWAATAAGALAGLGLAVGFEGMPFLVLCGAAFVLRYGHDGAGAPALRAYGMAAAASTLAGFAANTAPDHWGQSACDSLALNSAIAVVIAGGGLTLATLALTTLRRDASRLWRCGLVSAVGSLAVIAFVAAEPRCLAGPYAMVDPAVHPLWLAHVREMQPLLSVLAEDPATGLGIAVFPLVGLLAVAVLAQRPELRRNFGFLAASAALVLAVAMMLAAIKGYAYAMWLAMPLVAVMALRLFLLLRFTALVPRFLLGLLLTPTVLSAGAISIAQAAGLQGANALAQGAREACFRSASYAPLAELPAGLMVADIDYGPFLLALTPHSVLAAPYHRLSSGIIAAHRIFASPPDEAQHIAARVGAAYVVLCGPRAPSDLSDHAREASLWQRLKTGVVPDWLVPAPMPQDTPFHVYRVR